MKPCLHSFRAFKLIYGPTETDRAAMVEIERKYGSEKYTYAEWQAKFSQVRRPVLSVVPQPMRSTRPPAY